VVLLSGCVGVGNLTVDEIVDNMIDEKVFGIVGRGHGGR
jgi:hypothetical protein